MDSIISTLGTLTETASGDLVVVVDISDLSMASSGTTKKLTLGALKTYVLTGLTTGAVWGSITGALSSQSDLVAAFNALNATNLTSGTVAAARGGAGTINGILKANGSGVVSLAVAGTDYVTVAQVVSVQDSLSASISGKQSALTFSTGLTLTGSTVTIANPYNPAAVAITGGTMSGVTITGSPISGSTVSATSVAASGASTGGNFSTLGNSGRYYFWTFGQIGVTADGTFELIDGAAEGGVRLNVKTPNLLRQANGTANQTLSIGAASGTGGGVLVLHQSASAPTPSSQDAIFYSLTGGEGYGMDGSGNQTLLTPHATDAPEWLYEVGRGADNIEKKINVFTAQITFWNADREKHLHLLNLVAQGLGVTGTAEESQIAWSEVFARRSSGRLLCKSTETFTQYEARTGVSLVPADQDKAQWLAMTSAERWQKVESARVAKSQETIDTWQARKDAFSATAQVTEFTEAKPIPYAATEVPEFLQ